MKLARWKNNELFDEDLARKIISFHQKPVGKTNKGKVIYKGLTNAVLDRAVEISRVKPSVLIVKRLIPVMVSK